MNMNEQKKTAVRAGTPATENRKTFSINSIIKNGGKVKCVIKMPGEVPQIINAEDIPQEFISRKLKAERIDTFFSLVYEPKSKEPMNLAFNRTTYRGTVLIVNRGLRRLYRLDRHNTDDAVVWLMRHRV